MMFSVWWSAWICLHIFKLKCQNIKEGNKQSVMRNMELKNIEIMRKILILIIFAIQFQSIIMSSEFKGNIRKKM